MMTRTISTACCRLTARASSRGAVPNTSPVTAGLARSGCFTQLTNAAMPACATRPSHDLFSADIAANQGSLSSMAAIAAVPRAPVARSRRRTVSAWTPLRPGCLAPSPADRPPARASHGRPLAFASHR